MPWPESWLALLFFVSSGVVFPQVGSAQYPGNLILLGGMPNQAGDEGDGGIATDAKFGFVRAAACDPSGNLYVIDGAYEKIRRIDNETKIITAIAGNGVEGSTGDGGPAVNASILNPQAIVFVPPNSLVFAETESNRLRIIDLDTGQIDNFAGTGVAGFGGDGGSALDALFDEPRDLAIDSDGNLYVADSGNGRVRKIESGSGTVSTVAGGGPGVFADGALATDIELVCRGLAVDQAGGLFVHDSYQFVNFVDPETGRITRIAGTEVRPAPRDYRLPPLETRLGYITDLTAGADGALYISESYFTRRLSPDRTTLRVYAGRPLGDGLLEGIGGKATAAYIPSNRAVCVLPDGTLVLSAGTTLLGVLPSTQTPVLRVDGYMGHRLGKTTGRGIVSTRSKKQLVKKSSRRRGAFDEVFSLENRSDFMESIDFNFSFRGGKFRSRWVHFIPIFEPGRLNSASGNRFAWLPPGSERSFILYVRPKTNFRKKKSRASATFLVRSVSNPSHMDVFRYRVEYLPRR